MPQQQINVVLRLLNGRRFQSAMYQSATSIRHAKSEMEAAASASAGLSRGIHSAEAALFAIGAASRFATYGLGVVGTTLAGIGIQFNATMESNSLAFEHFAGGVSESKALTKDLFEIAKQTPFAFEDITTAGRRFLAMGFNVQETTDLLRTLGDTLAYTGGGTDEIFRLTKAFGDIRAKGRLMQQELNQLTNLGINPYEMLAKGGLQLTEKQLKNIGRAGIDGQTAIDALKRGLDATFGGGAQKYMETFNGQWQRLQDNIKGTSGAATTGIFGMLKDGLTDLNDFLEGDGGQKTASIMKDVFENSLKVAGVAFLFLKERVMEFLDTIGPARPFLENVLIPLIKGLAVSLAGGLVVAWKLINFQAKLFAHVLGFVGTVLGPFTSAIEVVGYIIGLVFGGWILKTLGTLSKFGGVLGTVGHFFQFLAVIWNGAYGGARLLLRGVTFLIGVLGRVIKPVGWVISKFRELGHWIWVNTGGMLTKVANKLGRFGNVFFNIAVKIKNGFIKGLKTLPAAVLALFSSAGDLAGNVGDAIRTWINDHTPFGDKVDVGLFSFDLPALGDGGWINPGGMALVGERGTPELAQNVGGRTRITPLKPSSAARGGGVTGLASSSGPAFTPRPQVIQLVVSKRVLAEVVGDEVQRKRDRE